MLRSRFLCLAVVPVVFVTLGACGSVSTSPPPAAVDAGESVDATLEAEPDDSGDDGGPTTCALPASFGSRKCNECVGATCCMQLAECAADATCDSLMKCILGCIDEVDAGACANVCLAQFSDPNAVKKWRALEQCAGFVEPCRFHCSTQY